MATTGCAAGKPPSRLGLERNREAYDELLGALADDSDWRLNFVAAVALGRIGDPRAVPALTATALLHWYPPVRSAARKALAVISGQDSYPKDGKPPAGHFRFGAPATEYLDQTDLRADSRAAEERPFLALRTGSDELNQAELEQASHHAAVASTPDGRSCSITPVPPRCGLRVDGGILLGRNRGEWGGDLVFAASPTDVRLLIHDNITGIHRLPCGIVAVAGGGHKGNCIAHLYLVTRSTAGVWSARKWRSLPAAPVRSGFLPDGRLLIACANRENIVLSADGLLSMANESQHR